MENVQTPAVFKRIDYRPPSYWVEHVELIFELLPDGTEVTAILKFRKNQSEQVCAWLLNGEELELLEISVNNKELHASEYKLTKNGLSLFSPPDQGELKTRVRIHPEKNTRLEGLYLSKGNYFTQCEAEGFRRITFFPDRPDVMARYTVTLRANQITHPILLSNGNLIAQRDLANNWHEATWEDPFPKPCYLFALVAGQLVCQECTHELNSGKQALLQIWVEQPNLDKTAHAMQSLIKSIIWDENTFGLSLDLDRFMIVAVDDFNMGAMENKGLNIFNSKFVLANPSTATDIDYDNIQSVVAHEYFHNWTGNRVTCRSWFELSLKEGLTVFRDQVFSAEMMAEGLSNLAAESARAVKRIEDVKVLRALQFPEDAGPMSHPIRPDSYLEINNFYTVTVYEKGAEVIRMLHTLLGPSKFRQGMDIYFQRHDGQAVTCDDFINAMENALQKEKPEANLMQFRRWYSQSGTPIVAAHGMYDETKAQFHLTLSQHCPTTADQTEKAPLHIPIAVGLIDSAGKDIPLQLAGEAQAQGCTRILSLQESAQTFVFENVHEAPLPSLLRNFSAPVILQANLSDKDDAFLLAHDSDGFNRWEASQRLYTRLIVAALQYGDLQAAELQISLQNLIQAITPVIEAEHLSPAYRALLLTLPSEATLAEQLNTPVDPLGIARIRQALKTYIAHTFQNTAIRLLSNRVFDTRYQFTQADSGLRSLHNLMLSWLCDCGQFNQAVEQFQRADNMTDQAASLTALVHSHAPEAEDCLKQFEQRWEQHSLVMDKWLTIQSTQPSKALAPTLHKIRSLFSHTAFSIRNPNKVRALITAFCMNNPTGFHALDGSGYEFWSEKVIELDSINPQIAARLARAMDRWTRFTPRRQSQITAALQLVRAHTSLSSDVREVVEKALATHPIQK